MKIKIKKTINWLISGVSVSINGIGRLMGAVKTWILNIFIVIFLTLTILVMWRLFFGITVATLQNQEIISICLFILALITILSFAYYRLIENNISKKISEDLRRERSFSKADQRISLGVFHMHLYKAIFKERTVSDDDKECQAKKEIDSALRQIQMALTQLDSINEKDCRRQLFLIKNNLAYYLAIKWNYYKEKKSNKSFKNYLKKEDKRVKEYNGDKRIAEEYINHLKDRNASSLYIDLAPHFVDTFKTVERVFSVEADNK